jgi:glycosyltransferase involved in cell wall biosynthesis
MRLLFINIYTMGHVAYHELLTESLATYFPEVEVTAFRLPDVIRQDKLGHIAHRLLRQRLPGLRHWDAGFQRLRSELAHSLVTRRLLGRVLQQNEPDVVHIHTQSLALLSPDLMRSRPTVISLDNTTALLGRLRSKAERSGYGWLKKMEERVFAAATGITCFSHFVRRSVVDDYGVPEEKVTTIYPATRLSSFANIHRKYVAVEPVRLLFVGNDFVRKGGEDLLAVVAQGIGVPCELDIVSNDPISVSQFPGVRLHKGIRPYSQELIQLYQAADIFVMPTREDCLGHVFVEAMAAGLPTVGSTVMAVPEVVRDGITGLGVPPGDLVALRLAIQRLALDPSLRETFGLQGRRVAMEEFDPEMNATRTMQLYRSVLGKRREPTTPHACGVGKA